MPSIQELVTPVVAALGLGLSVFNTIQARRDKRPKLRVRLSFGLIGYGPELSDQQVLIEVANAWDQPITLSSISIPLPDKCTMAFIELEGEKRMPVLLAPGTSTQFWRNSARLEAETIKAGIGQHSNFRVMARDALGNKYLSNRLSFKPKRRVDP